MRACNCARASPLQSRTRVGCDSMRNTFDIVSSQFQSTHPRGVRRGQHPARTHPGPVSIHAPAWGATSARALSSFPRSVSIHAPAWGATCQVSGIRRPSYVSIHAPAWGATSARGTARHGSRFQSTHPRGVRRDLPDVPGRYDRFQSTHPRGVRRRILFALQAAGRGFNPRTRVGCDHKTASDGALRMRFNPRTRVGCDTRQLSIRQIMSIKFQSTHPRGVRLFPCFIQ